MATISKDIHTDSQLQIGKTRKTAVLGRVPTNDRALALSGQLAGGMTRVGAAEKAAIARLGVRVVDASQEGWGIINHDLFLSNTDVQQVIRRAVDGTAA